MSIEISNPSADRNDKIANAAKVLGRSEDRKKVFLAIYTGKKRIKTVNDIMKLTDLNNIRVLQEAKRLSSESIIKQMEKKVNKKTAYEKIDFYTHNKNAIIRLAGNKEKLNKFPTKINPHILGGMITLHIPQKMVNVKQIYIDDIDSFSKVKGMNPQKIKSLYETEIKEGLKKIISEDGKFTDWGGETDDLFSTQLKINKKRVSVAFALKGKGTTGILTPKKMGKNADQIQRLFKSPADVFIIQYTGQIAESVIDQMKTMAIAKSVTENRKIYFGIIDIKDMSRLIGAYPKLFQSS